MRVDVAERSINTELIFDLLAELGFNFDCRKVELTQTFESESQNAVEGHQLRDSIRKSTKKGFETAAENEH